MPGTSNCPNFVKSSKHTETVCSMLAQTCCNSVLTFISYLYRNSRLDIGEHCRSFWGTYPVLDVDTHQHICMVL